MKRILGFTFAFVALLILVGCGEEAALDTPDVDYAVTDNGATLELSWVEIADADGYYIYADDVAIDTIDDPATTTFDATTPAAVYGVQAYAGEDVSEIDEIDCTPVETQNITVYSLMDPDTSHHSAIQFTTTGSCVTLAVVVANYADIDFWFNDSVPTHGPVDIVSPGDHAPTPYNSEDNASANCGTDYDGLDITTAPGGYSTQTAVADQAVYSLWVDPNANGWDAQNDYFAKMKVESLTGGGPYTITITVAYQTIPGLRWVVTQ